jgi:hypothetical protein
MSRLVLLAACLIACRPTPAPQTPLANSPVARAAPVPASESKDSDQSWPALAEVQADSLAVARAWAEALGKSDRKVLAALTHPWLKIEAWAEGSDEGCGEEPDNAEELLTATCFTDTKLFSTLADLTCHDGSCPQVVVKPYDGVATANLDEDSIYDIREDELVTVAITKSGYTDYLLLAIVNSKVRAAYYDRFKAVATAAVTSPPKGDLGLARSWLHALANKDVEVIAKTTHFPLRSVNPQNSPGRPTTVRRADEVLYGGVAHGMLVVALLRLDENLVCKENCSRSEVEVDTFDLDADGLPEDLEKYSREIKKLIKGHASMVRVTLVDTGHTNYVLLAIKEGKVHAAFGTGWD